MDLGLQGHVTLITGAASGIGLATAECFAEEGCELLLWDVHPRVEEIADQFADKGISVQFNVVDIVDANQLAVAVTQLAHSGKSLDHVVHCAATSSGCFGFPFTRLSVDDWKRTLDVNVMGMVNIAHSLTPLLVQSQRGTFVFLASVAGQIGSQTDPPYSASKAANINFAQCMAKDLAAHNIRVNTVCPGMVQTPLNRSVWQAWHDRTPIAEQLTYEQWAEQKIRQLVPLGRWQTPDDVAAMIVFLSSDRSKNVTGQTINVDGGFVMHW